MTRHFCDRCGEEIKLGHRFIVSSGLCNDAKHNYEICGKCYTGHYEYMENKADGPVQKELKKAINTMQWVQEYIEAVGEGHKDAYVNGLQGAMDNLMGLVQEDEEE